MGERDGAVPGSSDNRKAVMVIPSRAQASPDFFKTNCLHWRVGCAQHSGQAEPNLPRTAMRRTHSVALGRATRPLQPTSGAFMKPQTKSIARIQSRRGRLITAGVLALAATIRVQAD